MNTVLAKDSDRDLVLTKVRIRATKALVTSGTCTYSVTRTSDSVEIASGVLTHVSGGNWLGVLEKTQMTSFVIGEEVNVQATLVSGSYDRTWNEPMVVGLSGTD